MDMEKLVALCRRRGFIFQSSEIYGGINGFWDYGPLGVELKKNIKDVWWQDMVRNPPPGPEGQEIEMVGVDCSIIMNPKVWESSGHVGGFADPMVDCKKCRRRFRADKVFFVRFPGQFSPIYMGGFEADSSSDATRLIADKMAKLPKKHDLPPALVGQYQSGAFQIISALDLFAENQQRQEDTVIPPPGTLASGICPAQGCGGQLTSPRSFNLMFQTYVGAIQTEENIAYLRPETAQGIFANFKNVLDSTRLKLPFGIAQVGKAFRNEINPRNYTFRSREFEQMEIEFFCHPNESRKWYEYWRDVRIRWYTQLGIRSDRLRPREQTEKERAHYSVGTTDIEYLFPFSDEPQELEGVAHRADFDLRSHMEGKLIRNESGEFVVEMGPDGKPRHPGGDKDLRYFDEELWAKADKSAYGGDKKKEQEAKSKMPYRFVPHVIEPSAGADRFALAVLCEAYTEDKIPDEKGVPQERIVMKFHPRLAPVKAAILPLVNKEGMPEVAQKLYRELKQEFNVYYDNGGAVGRRYRRQDEIGTPYCFTIDGQTLQDQTVTLRDRDTTQQTRLSIGAIAAELRERLRAQT
jgi:glycyl-tRNA synthetase